MLLYVGLVIVLGMVLLKIYVECIKGWCKSKVDLTGKTVLVTGANTGIGYWTALDLARRNARVILACRNTSKGQEALEKIVECTGNKNVVVRKLDISLMKSVREFAERFLSEEGRLDILVNNAGVAGLPLTMTEEGFETIMATNHFGPFLLTNLLLDLIQKSTPSRIVNVSSVGHAWTNELDTNNLRAEKSYSIQKFYYYSKLGNVLFTRELARRLQDTDISFQFYSILSSDKSLELSLQDVSKDMSHDRIGQEQKEISKTIEFKCNCVLFAPRCSCYGDLETPALFACYSLFSAQISLSKGVTVCCLHPGPVLTPILHSFFPKLLTPLFPIIATLYIKSPEEGAQTSIYCAVSEELEGQSGKYYMDCKDADTQSSELSKDMGLAKKLWEVSERLTGMTASET